MRFHGSGLQGERMAEQGKEKLIPVLFRNSKVEHKQLLHTSGSGYCYKNITDTFLYLPCGSWSQPTLQ